MSEHLDGWVRAYAAVTAGHSSACPRCGQGVVHARFIGDPATRIGYALLWCDMCRLGQRLSRLRVPDDLEPHGWDDDTALDGLVDVRFEP